MAEAGKEEDSEDGGDKEEKNEEEKETKKKKRKMKMKTVLPQKKSEVTHWNQYYSKNNNGLCNRMKSVLSSSA